MSVRPLLALLTWTVRRHQVQARSRLADGQSRRCVVARPVALTPTVDCDGGRKDGPCGNDPSHQSETAFEWKGRPVDAGSVPYVRAVATADLTDRPQVVINEQRCASRAHPCVLTVVSLQRVQVRLQGLRCRRRRLRCDRQDDVGCLRTSTRQSAVADKGQRPTPTLRATRARRASTSRAPASVMA